MLLNYLRPALMLVMLHLPVLFYAQQGTVDSLRLLLINGREDTIRANIYGQLALELRNNDPDTAIYYANRAIEISRKLHHRRGIRNASLYLGVALTNRGEYYEALRVLDTSLAVSREMKDEIFEAKVLTNIGNIYSEQGNYPAALNSYFEALKLREKNPGKDQKGLAGALTNIGIIHRLMGNYDEALEYYRRSMEIKTKLGDKKSIADLYVNIGNIAIIRKNYSEAIADFTRALQFFTEADDHRGIRTTYNNIGVVYDEMGRFDEAMKQYELYLTEATRANDKPAMAEARINLGNTLFRQRKFAEAEKQYREAERISIQTGAFELKRNVYLDLYRIDSVAGDAGNALAHYKLFVAYRDSLVNKDNTKRAVQVQLKYEFDRKSAADSIRNAEQQKQENLKHENEIRQQKLFTYGGIAGFLLMLVVAIVSTRAFRNKKKANEIISRQKDIVEMKQKEILDSIHYAKRIQQSLLPNERYISAVLKSLID